VNQIKHSHNSLDGSTKQKITRYFTVWRHWQRVGGGARVALSEPSRIHGFMPRR